MAEVSWSDHDHRGEYADTSHGHGFHELLDVAEEHHRHYDTESEIHGLREDLGRAGERIRELEDRQAALLRALREAAVLHEARQRAGLADETYLPVSEELFELLTGLAAALAGEDDEEDASPACEDLGCVPGGPHFCEPEPVPGTCGSCRKNPVRDRTSPSLDGVFCGACLDRCADSEIADHVCAVDRWAEEQGQIVTDRISERGLVCEHCGSAEPIGDDEVTDLGVGPFHAACIVKHNAALPPGDAR